MAPGGCGRSETKEWNGEKLCNFILFQINLKSKLTSSQMTHMWISILILVGWVNQAYLPRSQTNRENPCFLELNV